MAEEKKGKSVGKKEEKKEDIKKGAFGRPLEFVTDSPLKAEILQKATGVMPAVTGNRLYGDRKYSFNLLPKKAREILGEKEEKKEEKIPSHEG